MHFSSLDLPVAIQECVDTVYLALNVESNTFVGHQQSFGTARGDAHRPT